MNFEERYKYNPSTDLIGRGGFSRVYKAFDNILERKVALKIYSGQAGKYSVIDEIKKMIKLEHPNIARYYNVEVKENTNSFGEKERLEIGIMEFLDAGELKPYFARATPLEKKQVILDVLHGLSYIHKCNVVHRDLKPGNVLITTKSDGTKVAKITDFGISKDGNSENTSTGLLGTVEYMSPEQFSPETYGINGKINHQVDLWAFGIMLFDLITGESFYNKRSSEVSSEQVIGQIMSNEVDLSKLDQLPKPYKEVVALCLRRFAKDRVQSADVLIEIIEKYYINNKLDEAVLPDIKVSVEADSDQTVVIDRKNIKNNIKSKESSNEEDFDKTVVIDRNTVNNNLKSKETSNVVDFDKTVVIDRNSLNIDSNTATNLTDSSKVSTKTSTTELKQSKNNSKIIVITLGVIVLGLVGFYFFTNKTNNLEDKKSLEQTLDDPLSSIFANKFVQINVDNSVMKSKELTDFEIYESEITVGDFKKFVDETNYITTAELKKVAYFSKSGNEISLNKGFWKYRADGEILNDEDVNLYPVVNVSIQDIINYCNWLNKKTNYKYKFNLPSELQMHYLEKSLNLKGMNPKDLISSSNETNSSSYAIKLKKTDNNGLYDILGNVNEIAWEGDKFYAVGGGFDEALEDILSTPISREFEREVEHYYFNIGFRLIKSKVK